MALTDYSIDTSGTQADVQRRQKMADALLQHGMDTSAAAGGKNGGWLTALNRGLAGALGGYQTAQANQLDQANRKAGQDATNAYLTGMNPATQGSVPTSLSAAQPPTADAAASGIAPKEGMDPEGKPYTQDQLNPMDEPRGAARKNYLATMLGEEKPGSPEGLGVANVIRNRAVDGGYGGNTPDAVVQSPNQFSPWNDQAGRSRMANALQNPGNVAKANDQIDQAYGVGKYASAGPNDPTLGKTHFYDPGSMVPPNSVPKWAQGKEAQQIGKTMFLDDPDSATPPNSQMAQGQLPNQQQVMSAAGQPAPDVNAQRKASAAAVLLNRFAPDSIKKLAQEDLDRMTKQESYTQEKDAEGNIWSVNKQTGQRTIAKAAEKDTTTKRDYDSYVEDEKAAGRKPVSFGQFSGKVDAPGSASDPNAGLSGPELLKTLSPDDATIVKKIADHEVDPNKLSIVGGHRERLLALASRYDPEYDASLAPARFAAKKEFLAGGPNAPSSTIVSGGTTIGHLLHASDVSQKLGGPSGYGPLTSTINAANSAYKTASNDPNAKEYDTTIGRIAEEGTKFYRGVGGTESDIQRDIGTMGRGQSQESRDRALATQASLIYSKVDALQDRYKNAMGTTAWEKIAKENNFPVISDKNREAVNTILRRGGLPPIPSKSGQTEAAPSAVHPDAIAEAKRRGLIP